MRKQDIDEVKTPLMLFLCWLCVWFYVFYETLESAASVWINSNTYMHCFFIIPIAIFFFNERKQFVFVSEPKPLFAMVIPLIGLQVLWLLGFAADVGLFMHAAVFGMLSCVIVMFLGLKIAKILWFPLVFIVFSIPLGEELVPYFQVVTAELSVQFLLWSGVPVYRDGMFITVPGGFFEVAEACSGVRFFVACVVMGAVISYVSYTSIWKRTVFFLLSILAPILANGVRAYGTIMVGNLAGIEYAKGADHLVYGWGFFAFIVVVLLIVSRIGSEQPLQFHLDENQRRVHLGWNTTNWMPIGLFAALPLIVTAFTYQEIEGVINETHLNVKNQPGDTVFHNKYHQWMPKFVNPTVEHLGSVEQGYDYYVVAYNKGEPGSELVSETNRFFDIERWRYIDSSHNEFSLNSSRKKIRATLVHIGASNGRKRVVLYWYYLPNFSSSNTIHVKLMQAVNMLLGKGDAGAAIAISLTYEEDFEVAKKLILQHASEHAQKMQEMVVFK